MVAEPEPPLGRYLYEDLCFDIFLFQILYYSLYFHLLALIFHLVLSKRQVVLSCNVLSVGCYFLRPPFSREFYTMLTIHILYLRCSTHLV